MKINKILIANRGEIACRIIQTCQKLGIETVAIYANIERNSRHVQLANEAFCIHSETPTSAYLDIQSIIDIAKKSNADAIHPGYGFLSERAEFAQAIEVAGLIFIGAPIEALKLMGSKAAAKASMLAAGVPCVPGYHGDNQGVDFLQTEANKIGYPLLIKASSGGGGKGMKIVTIADDFIDALNSAKREALKSFGNDHVILERFITKPKHIEVQVFADSHDNVVHLFERDCSTQRRYQKIIEEAPATCISDITKQSMYKAAISAAKAVNYRGAGTIEFIVEDDEFFFMEMNTRLQVEHRVTEMITNTDLVEWQIIVAEGNELPLKQSQIQCNGHAIQVRIYAEDSFNDFLPSTGLLEQVEFPQQDNIIVDTGIQKSDSISIHFDPMIAKIVCWQETRDKCVEKTLQSMDDTFISGVKTNLPFLSEIMSLDVFSDNQIYTNSLDNGTISVAVPEIDNQIISNLAHKLYFQETNSIWQQTNHWSNSGDYFNHFKWLYHGENIVINAKFRDDSVILDDGSEEQVLENTKLYKSNKQILLIHNHHRYIFDIINHEADSHIHSNNNIVSPMPGKILQIKVSEGDKVTKDQTLIIMEAMKMELTLKANSEGNVEKVSVKENDIVSAGTVLIELV